MVTGYFQFYVMCNPPITSHITDASARDDSLYQQVIDVANAQDKPNVTVHFFYSGNGCNGFGHYEDIKIVTGGHGVKQINVANFKAFATFVTSSYDDANSERKESSTPASCQHFQLSYFVSRLSTLIETSRSSVASYNQVPKILQYFQTALV